MDGWVCEPGSCEFLSELLRQPIEIRVELRRSRNNNRNINTIRGLSYLVFDQPGCVGQDAPDDVRMNRDLTVSKDLVTSAIDARDAGECRADRPT